MKKIPKNIEENIREPNMHFLTYIIIPKDIFSKSAKYVVEYIDKTMEKYWTDYECNNVVTTMTIDQLNSEFETYKNTNSNDKYKFENVFEYALDRYEYKINNNVIVDFVNHDARYDWFAIGGRFSSCIKIPKDISNNNSNDESDDNDDTDNKDEKSKIEKYSMSVNDFIENHKKYGIESSEYYKQSIRQKFTNGSIVDENGIFHEIDYTEFDETLFLKILERNKDNYIVVLDLHI